MAITQVNENSVCAVMKSSEGEGFCSITKRENPNIGFYVDPGYEHHTNALIAAACLAAKPYLNPSQRIYVDADASDGLWDSLGFKVNPYYDFTEEQREWEGAGYEKYIVFSDLCAKMGV